MQVQTTDLAGHTVLLVRSEQQADDGQDLVLPWDAASRSPIGHRVSTWSGPDRATTTALASVSGRPVLVCGYQDGTSRRWDLTTGRQQPPLTGHHGAVLALWAGTLAGRPVTVSGGGDAAVWVWDLATGRAWGPPLTGPARQVNSVMAGTVDGRALVVSGDADGTIRQWGVQPPAH